MYASDYAHWDSEFPESVRRVASIPGLTDTQKRHVLGRNAVTWFSLTPEELPETSVYFQSRAEAALRGSDALEARLGRSALLPYALLGALMQCSLCMLRQE